MFGVSFGFVNHFQKCRAPSWAKWAFTFLMFVMYGMQYISLYFHFRYNRYFFGCYKWCRLTYHQLSWGYVSGILQKIYWRTWTKISSNSLNSKISWFWGQIFAHQLSQQKNNTHYMRQRRGHHCGMFAGGGQWLYSVPRNFVTNLAFAKMFSWTFSIAMASRLLALLFFLCGLFI